MKKKFKNIVKSKFFLLCVFPVFLIFLWFVLTYAYIVKLDTTFSIISQNLPLSSFNNLNREKIIKGDMVSGMFMATEDNLGILSIRFQTFFRPAYQDEDKLLFQIKEEGSKSWYYERVYRDGTIYDVPFFPFGFPIIHNSKGKTYIFKLTSLKGDEDNSIALSPRGQILSAKYKYTRAELLGNKKFLLNFAVKKFVNAIQTTDVIFSSLIYLLPLMFYSLLLIFRKRLEEIIKRLLIKFELLGKTKLFYFLIKLNPVDRVLVVFLNSLLLLAISIDILYLQLDNDYIYIIIPILWIWIQSNFKLGSKGALVIGIGLLLLPPILNALNLEPIAKEASAYAFIFLTTGFIQALFELRKTTTKHE